LKEVGQVSEFRIREHPILSQKVREELEFFFDGRPLKAYEGEMISTALFAQGIRIFGKHQKDGAPQGIFCANGQCAQCLVLADGVAVKSCVTEVKQGMKVLPIEGLPALPEDDSAEDTSGFPKELEVEVFIMGGGPAGLAAAAELGAQGVSVVIADDKHELGGKLGLQTHNFFGSVKDCNAGMRGMDIGTLLEEKVAALDTVEVWLNSPVVGVFSDKKIGVVKDGSYVLVRPGRFLVAAGAREKALAFPGCDLPGVYGAGAFQTLVNRDQVRAASRLFVVGGGNVGLIAAYHALQAGIDVLGLVEALPNCGGYKVHLDKVKRLGVPIWTSHTVLRAEGDGKLERVVICGIDRNFQPIPGTEGVFEADTLLIAVGLSSVNEMFKKAQEFGMKVFAAGDAAVIAEASAAIFSGKIVGREILQDMGFETGTPVEWNEMVEVLRSKPGAVHECRELEEVPNHVYPVIRCVQEIPCNPCSESCLIQSLKIDSESIMPPPSFAGNCAACGRCVAICPGLAITLVDESYDETKKKALVAIPWELPEGSINIGDVRTTTGFEGAVIGQGKVVAIKESPWQDRRKLVYVEVPWEERKLVAGMRVREPAGKKAPLSVKAIDDAELIVCRCERVSKKDILDKIKEGCLDFNTLKAELRIGMGPCGGKTCLDLIWRLFREAGVDFKDVGEHIYRPFELEVPLQSFLTDPEGGDQ